MLTAPLPVHSRKEAGRAIQEMRVNEGLSPEQLGYLVGISGRTIRRIEDGRAQPTVRTMFLIAQEFDINVTDLWPL